MPQSCEHDAMPLSSVRAVKSTEGIYLVPYLYCNKLVSCRWVAILSDGWQVGLIACCCLTSCYSCHSSTSLLC